MIRELIAGANGITANAMIINNEADIHMKISSQLGKRGSLELLMMTSLTFRTNRLFNRAYGIRCFS